MQDVSGFMEPTGVAELHRKPQQPLLSVCHPAAWCTAQTTSPAMMADSIARAAPQLLCWAEGSGSPA